VKVQILASGEIKEFKQELVTQVILMLVQQSRVQNRLPLRSPERAGPGNMTAYYLKKNFRVGDRVETKILVFVFSRKFILAFRGKSL
jgi:hypothetical protein